MKQQRILLHHRRRHRRLQVPRPDPPPARARHRRARGHDAARRTQFVTPLSVGALTGDRVFTDLFDLDDEREIGHIRLSREADLIVVAPATADLLAKMAGGHADDLATAVLLATDKPVLVAPAMNPRMWLHPATQRNVAQLAGRRHPLRRPERRRDGRARRGRARAAWPRSREIVAAIEAAARRAARRAAARRRTPARRPPRARHRGPDARADRSRALHRQPLVRQAGRTPSPRRPRRSARASRWSRGPVSARRSGRRRRSCASRRRARCWRRSQAALPADIAIFAAAVADWRVADAGDEKIKKGGKAARRRSTLVENPDILKTIAASARAGGRRSSSALPPRPRT